MAEKLEPPVVTYSKITGDLKKLGVKTGDLVELHASVKATGWVVGGPDTVLQAILDVIDTQGTLMMLAGWEDNPYHLPE